jgi:amidase
VAAGLPSTAAPNARGGIPLAIGVQIVGPYREDRTTIAFASLIDLEFAGLIAFF